MSVLKMTDLDLSGKRVLIRQDLNVPIKDGKITSTKRIDASLPTIRKAIDAGAAVMVMSHLGRPTEGQYAEEFSLAPVAAKMSELLGAPVRLAKEWLDGIEVSAGEVVLCENVRFNIGEKKNNEALGQKMAALCDVFVMDAFGTAHRAQASTNMVAKLAPVACAGPLLAAELDALGRGLDTPVSPTVAIIGGSKVSTKLTVLDNLSDKVDQLIVGGGIANTFIKAAGHNVGKSLCEDALLPEALRLMQKAREADGEIPVPTDVVTGKEFSDTAEAVIKNVTDIEDDDMILDIGPETRALYDSILQKAGTIIWNGPVGVFEIDQFGEGTKALCLSVAQSSAFSIAGGGDTVAAVDKYGVGEKVSYISTGGGAFLEFVEGKKLPAVAVLEERSK